MKKLTVATIGIVTCCCVILPAVGQSSLPPKSAAPEGQTVHSEILFPLGQGRLDSDFEDNGSHLLRFTGELNRILADTNYVVSGIAVSGSASPDGELRRNLQLARQRAASLRNYLVAQCRIPAEKIETINLGENWAALRSMIESSDMSYRDEMLSLMDQNPDDRDTRKHKMMYYANSEPWLWMRNNFFDKLRIGSGVSFSYKLSPAAKQRAVALAQKQETQHPTMPPVVLSAEAATQTSSAQPPQPEQSVAPMPRQYDTFSARLALKTDLMLWGGVMPGFEMGTWTPNLSAEIYFAHRWSVQAGFAYSNWNEFTGTKALYAVSVADMEMRHWFGKPSRFRGFYLGVYGQYGQYDVQKDAQGNTGSFWCAGLGAGWMQSLSRHWALEGEIRGGYRSSQNNSYDIEEGHTYLNNKQNDGKFTPQLRVQVVYRFGKTQK